MAIRALTVTVRLKDTDHTAMNNIKRKYFTAVPEKDEYMWKQMDGQPYIQKYDKRENAQLPSSKTTFFDTKYFRQLLLLPMLLMLLVMWLVVTYTQQEYVY